MQFDDDIKKKHDLRTVEGKRNAEREQFARWDEYHRSSMSGVEKLFRFLWVFLKWTLLFFFAVWVFITFIGKN